MRDVVRRRFVVAWLEAAVAFSLMLSVRGLALGVRALAFRRTQNLTVDAVFLLLAVLVPYVAGLALTGRVDLRTAPPMRVESALLLTGVAAIVASLAVDGLVNGSSPVYVCIALPVALGLAHLLAGTFCIARLRVTLLPIPLAALGLALLYRTGGGDAWLILIAVLSAIDLAIASFFVGPLSVRLYRGRADG